ncbi:pyocin knob domain-containing protein [Providencia huaxiensis]|uniref:pyocin knob domain-containing protein n=2 Tax=Providencia TaxID=586 RepID=UPI002FE15A10
MYGLDNASGVNVMPKIAPVSSATPLWFTEGGAGLAASYPGQDWFNMVQAEMLAVLTKVGMKPEKGKLNQLAEAIAKMISNGDFATNEALKNTTSQTIFNRAIAIPLNADLNDYVNPGLYYQPNGSPGATGKNYPSNTAGSLEVIKTGNTSVKQIYTAWYENQTWIRRYNGSNQTWSDKWDEDYTKLNPPTAEAVGAYSKQQSDARFQQKGDYVDKNVAGEQVLKGTLAINGAAYVMSSGAGSDLLCIDSRYGKFGFLRRINGTYGGVVEVPYVGGTIALIEQTIGINQTWKNVTSNRGVGVSYTNTSKKPIFVALTGQAEGNGTAKVTVDGVTVATLGGVSTISINRGTSFIVPPGSKYLVESTAVVSTWSELS